MFSTKKVIRVSSLSSRVFSDDHITDVMDHVITDVVIKNNDTMDAFKNHALGGMLGNFNKFLRYGKSSYSRGLPTAIIASNNFDITKLKRVLSKLENTVVEIDYAQYSYLNPFHVAWDVLVNTYGYNFETNGIEGLTATYEATPYITGMGVIFPTGSAQRNAEEFLWADSTKDSNVPLVDENGYPVHVNSDENYVNYFKTSYGNVSVTTLRVGIIYQKADTTIVKTSIDIGLTDYHLDRLYYHAKYRAGNTVKYWTYDKSTGTIPELPGESLNNLEYVAGGDYFPVVMFRSEDKDLTTEAQRNSEQYQSSVRLLKTLGLDYQQLADAINENEDVGDLQQAALEISVPINSTDELDIEYLYQFFDSMYERLTDYEMLSSGSLSTSEYQIKFKEGSDYSYCIAFDGIRRTTRAGKIGAVGKYVSIQTFENVEIYPGDSETAPEYETRYNRLFRRQVEENLYEEIEVKAPKRYQVIYKGRQSISDNRDETCLIPVDYRIIRLMKPIKRSRLLQRSVRFVFNAMQIQKIRWYQQSWFGAFLLVVAVVLTIATAGAASGPAVGILTSIGLTGMALTIVNALVNAILINLVLNTAAQYVDAEIVLILAIVAVAFSFSAGKDGLLSSSNLLAAGNGLTQLSMKASEYDMREVQSDMLAEQERQTALTAELEAIREATAINARIDPFETLRAMPSLISGEDPSDYYARTIHAGNIGTLTYSYLHNYFAIQLELPKPENAFA